MLLHIVHYWNSLLFFLDNIHPLIVTSFHITTIYANTETHIWYQNHLESVYCISGEGEIETLADSTVYPIKPGTLYVLDKHDEHLLRGHSELKLACVFNPPLNGQEVHDKDGVYPLLEDS